MLYILYIYYYTRAGHNACRTRTRSVIYFLTDDGGADLTIHVLRPPLDWIGVEHDWLIKASFTRDTYIIIYTYTYKTLPRLLINHGKEKRKPYFE